jgi:hypothetical protein
MTAFITEHSNFQRLAALGLSVNLGAPLSGIALTSAAALGWSTNTEYVRVVCDQPTLFGIMASSTGAVPSSTNAYRLAANVPEIFSVPKSTSMRVMVSTT